MAIPDVTNIRSLRGWLCKDPTDIGLPFPHGGIALGVVKDGTFRPGIRTRVLVAEEWGNSPVEGVYAGEACILTCLLREFDADAMDSVFPNSVSGTVRNYPSTTREVRPGALATDRKIALLFSPRDIGDNPFIVIHKAMPMVQESMALQLMISTEATMGVMFQGIPDSAGRTYEMGVTVEL